MKGGERDTATRERKRNRRRRQRENPWAAERRKVVETRRQPVSGRRGGRRLWRRSALVFGDRGKRRKKEGECERREKESLQRNEKGKTGGTVEKNNVDTQQKEPQSAQKGTCDVGEAKGSTGMPQTKRKREEQR